MPQPRSGKDRPCEACGRRKYVQRAKLGRPTFCSIRCRTVVWRGTAHPNWRGGATTTTQGYLQDNRAIRLQHRIVAEKTMGRPLHPTEIVHHRDGNKQNNHPANLQVMTRAEHIREHRAQLHAARWRRR